MSGWFNKIGDTMNNFVGNLAPNTLINGMVLGGGISGLTSKATK